MIARKHSTEAGFTLIEFMVAMVLSLIVAAAVVALVVAVVRSNRQTIQSTRLNQELRATLNLVASDMRRARAVEDPLTEALNVAGNRFGAIDTANDGCIIYGYENAENGPWHMIRRDDNNRVVLVGEGDDVRPADCSGDGDSVTVLNSEQIAITDMAFTPATSAGDEQFVREFTVTITGQLLDTNPNAPPVQRTMSQTVYVRSIGAGI